MRELKVYVGADLVGSLTEEDNLWSLQYDPAWAARDDSFDLSPALPRATLRHVDGATRRPVQWYFDNLLPEEDLRRIVARDAGIRDHEDAFALLEYLGAESAGSLTLLPPGTSVPRDAALKPLSHAELSQRIRNLPRAALTRDAPKRMSVAGAQHKLLVVRKGDDLYEPVGATPSTHILKPDHPDAQTYPASTFLEHLTMRLADAAGLPVPAVGLLQVPEAVYTIERFDRIIEGPSLRPETADTPPTVRRLHVIDACQLLDKSRLFKHSGASVEALREAIERAGDVLTLPQRVFRWLVFNLLVANDDCHLKNLSFVVESHAITLAPHYDLLATGVYHTRALAAGDGRWPEVEMAVRLSDTVRRFSQVTPEAVFAAAAVLGVPRPVALRVTRDVVTRVLRHFDRIYAVHFPGEAALSVADGPAHADDGAALVPATPVADPVDAGALVAGADEATAQPQRGIERRLLRVLRYVILPEMRARLTT
ncbi:MAG: HipA domain-containing protein [Burkholderiaceae bacterium]